MNDKHIDHDGFRTFQLMDELENSESVSQRELASRLGIAVGLVNSYLKNLVAKGFVRVKNYPRNRYAYLLTPKGLAEKSRLALHHLNYFTGLYTTTRRDYLGLFLQIRDAGIGSVSFCGFDEVAEIAYLSLSELGLELVGIYDDVNCGKVFLGHTVQRISSGLDVGHVPLVLTSLKRVRSLRESLFAHGVSSENIYMLGAVGDDSNGE